MQLADLPDGQVVALMDAAEVLALELALSDYVLKHPDRGAAVRAFRAVGRANHLRECGVEDAVDAARGQSKA
ncbi:hypothetical protein ACH41E_30300 [Streptomyces sp. NPDC020412]|uniref:hypothetical protein n=1 Tax=Streptomyces sp. NPDC020412 TaxID=3365073 RepID=UPI0037A6DC4F